MSQPFKCPSCGGPLEYDGGDVTVRCEFCSNLVIVPEALRERFEEKRGAVPFLEQIANLKEIGRLIRDGNYIAATKLYRETFGGGLHEAKSAVEKLSGGNPVEVSSTFGVSSQQPLIKLPQSGRAIRLKGCSPFVLALLIVVPYAMGRFNNAVFKFAPDGKFITRIGGEGEEPGLFRALNAIAVDGKGRVFVSDTKGIQVFDTNGRYLDVFKIERNVAFGMVFNDKNELFVAARTQIIKFALNK